MKKTLLVAIAACLCFVLVGCNSDSKQDENDIARSMTYSKTFEGITYSVAGNWEERVEEKQVTYIAEYATIIVSSTEGNDFQSLASEMLATEGLAAENETVSEEIEINGVSGTKESFEADGRSVEIFALFAEGKTYCIVAVYDDISEQNKSYEAIDTLLSSIMFTADPNPESKDGEDITLEEKA